MIVFELACMADHRFEGWFASVEDFTRQEAVGMVGCPFCGDTAVRRLPSAKVRTGTSAVQVEERRAQDVPAAQTATPATTQVTLASVIREILARTEDVGRRFPEEARRIHYEEVPARPIRGVATAQETQELTDEGIPVVPLPMAPRGESH
jgi:hypothetical protein